eukprot:2931383-Prymnesium_polylepis.1
MGSGDHLADWDGPAVRGAARAVPIHAARRGAGLASAACDLLSPRRLQIQLVSARKRTHEIARTHMQHAVN